jgi:hypothetical protein
MQGGIGKVIVITLILFLAELQTAVASWGHNGCRLVRNHHLKTTCHCHPNYGNLAGSNDPFDTEYDVEKWEKAFRQGVARKADSLRTCPAT